MCIEALGNLAFDTIESATADEQDILGIYRNHALLGMLASTLRRYVHDGTLQQFEQALLHTLTTHVTCDGWVVTLAGNLVNLVDKHDASFGSLHVVVSHLQQACQDALDILTHIARFGQYCSIDNGKRYTEELGDGTCQKCLARTSSTHHDNVGLLDLHLVVTRFLQQSFVVVIHRY